MNYTHKPPNRVTCSNVRLTCSQCARLRECLKVPTGYHIRFEVQDGFPINCKSPIGPNPLCILASMFELYIVGIRLLHLTLACCRGPVVRVPRSRAKECWTPHQLFPHAPIHGQSFAKNTRSKVHSEDARGICIVPFCVAMQPTSSDPL